MPEYPALIATDKGLGAIQRGHGLTPAQVDEAALIVLGKLRPDYTRVIEETYFRWVPRVKWCQRMGEDICSRQGVWHGHWTPVSPSEKAHQRFTVIRHIRETTPS